MKKTLLATTMLVAGAGMAAADVTISGYGRFGLEYIENRAGGTEEETQVSSRLRITINASTETDTGVTFGARLRMQNDDSTGTTSGNASMFWMDYQGFHVELGNSNTAFDSVALTYDSEMGFQDSSFGDAQSYFYDYESESGKLADGYLGIYASYTISDVNVHFSYVDPNQTSVADQNEEVGIAADWTNGTFAVAAAYTSNGKGIDGNDIAFVGVAYSFNDAAKVGLNYYDNGDTTATGGGDMGNQWTLYGNYTMGATTLRAYVSEADFTGDGSAADPYTAATDTAYGIGADYKLADGVRVSGSVQSGHDGNTQADVGVRFDF